MSIILQKNVQDALNFPQSKMNILDPCMHAIFKKAIQETPFS